MVQQGTSDSMDVELDRNERNHVELIVLGLATADLGNAVVLGPDSASPR